MQKSSNCHSVQKQVCANFRIKCFKNGTDNFEQIPTFCMVFGMMGGDKGREIINI